MAITNVNLRDFISSADEVFYEGSANDGDLLITDGAVLFANTMGDVYFYNTSSIAHARCYFYTYWKVSMSTSGERIFDHPFPSEAEAKRFLMALMTATNGTGAPLKTLA